MIIAIDGPAGSGKSTTARAVAQKLDFGHLDSGAFYRALTLAAIRAGVPSEHWPELDAERLEEFDVSARADGRGFRILIGPEDVTDAIRSPEVNALVSTMARVPAVRDWLLDRLRAAAQGADLVADGRDIGTVVFPDADLKVYLTADPRERARRRLAQQRVEELDEETLQAEVERLEARDRMDREREIAPLRKAEDAVVVDTTALSFDEQVDRIVTLARSRAPGRSDPA